MMVDCNADEKCLKPRLRTSIGGEKVSINSCLSQKKTSEKGFPRLNDLLSNWQERAERLEETQKLY